MMYKTSARLISATLLAASIAGISSGVATAASQKGTCAGMTFTQSGTCTVLAKESITFTIKGGNGGRGGAGGWGGAGGRANDGSAIMVMGGRGGSGGIGGAGGRGAKISGTYTNIGTATVTLTVTIGTNGADAPMAVAGTYGTDATFVAPGGIICCAGPGTDGGPGEDGDDGEDGSASEISVDGSVLVSAAGGSGGTGGRGGTGGKGATPSAVGLAGVAGAEGTRGAAGDSDSLPAPLPKAWSFVPLNPFYIGENASATFASGGVAKAKMTIPRIYGPHPILVARELGMTVPTGATVTLIIAAKSQSVCKLSPIGHLISSKKGTCTVTVTVKPKKGKSTSKSGSFKAV